MKQGQTPSEGGATRSRKTHQVTAPTQEDFDDLVEAAKRQKMKPNTLAGALWGWALPMFRAAAFNVDHLDDIFGDAVRLVEPPGVRPRKRGPQAR